MILTLLNHGCPGFLSPNFSRTRSCSRAAKRILNELFTSLLEPWLGSELETLLDNPNHDSKTEFSGVIINSYQCYCWLFFIIFAEFNISLQERKRKIHITRNNFSPKNRVIHVVFVDLQWPRVALHGSV